MCETFGTVNHPKKVNLFGLLGIIETESVFIDRLKPILGPDVNTRWEMRGAMAGGLCNYGDLVAS